MTDENKTTGDDEYQFPEEEYVTGEQEQPSTSYEKAQAEEPSAATDTEASGGQQQAYTSSSKFSGLLERFPFLRNKRVLLVIGVAVVAIIMFKIMTPSHRVKVVKKSTSQSQITSQSTAQDALLSKLDQLSQDASHGQSTTSQLKSQVADLKTSLDTANVNGAAMRTAIVALAQQVQNLTKEMKAANAQPKKQHPPEPIITYHLVALVSGRAWLMGSNSVSDSVTVGTKLKHYGRIKAIDPETGKVLTTSGKVITFNVDGN